MSERHNNGGGYQYAANNKQDLNWIEARNKKITRPG
jgi:hypothetical protein